MKVIRKDKTHDSGDDLVQASFRLGLIRYLVLAIFFVLAGRLWYLQVMNSGVYAEQSDLNRIRILNIPARRGTIYDRNGREIVTSRTSYNIVVTRKDVKSVADVQDLLVKNLHIDREWLEKRFADAQFEPKWESIVVKELATLADVAWVEAHQYEHPEIRADEAPQRLYRYGKLAAHALGYVGEVSPEELKGTEFGKDKGFKLGDVIGKFGIERYYNNILMGKDGARRVIVDSTGRIQSEIERIEPVPGRDFYTTIDLDIQRVAEEQADLMPKGRGAIGVMDPRNGEMLAIVSRPAFDPNIFSQRAKTPEGKEEIRTLQEDPDKPLYNRVIQGTFPPGSTWKLMTSVAALNEGVITPKSSRIQDGGLQVGNYYLHAIGNHGQPDVVTAISVSADGYYYRLGLKLGVERFEKWVRIFRFGEKTGIDLPNEKVGIIPTRAANEMIARNTLKRLRERQGVEWSEKDELEVKKMAKFTDFDMAVSAFGQGKNALTPIQLLRYVGLLAMGGEAVTPHLMLRAVAGIDREGNAHPEVRYEDKSRYTVPMSPEIAGIVKKGMWSAVNAGGTSGGTAIPGFDVCGKTGTAQVASTQRVGKESKDHAWFMSFAPRDNPEICSVILTENVGFGSTYSVPRARALYEDYYGRTRNLPMPEAGDALATKTEAKPKVVGR
jgi:penicillin-binding protein 2